MENQEIKQKNKLLQATKIFCVVAIFVSIVYALILGFYFFVVGALLGALAGEQTLEITSSVLGVYLLFISPLITIIPFNAVTLNRIKKRKKFFLAYKICFLIFGNIVSGILLLVNKNK